MVGWIPGGEVRAQVLSSACHSIVFVRQQNLLSPTLRLYQVQGVPSWKVNCHKNPIKFKENNHEGLKSKVISQG